MNLEIFDAEHGACALLTCSNGARLMIDCGHNASTGWQPGSYLQKQGITHLDMLAITNYDEDHVSGLPNLLKNVNVKWLWRNNTVSAQALQKMKSENGIGNGIKSLLDMMPGYSHNPETLQPNFINVNKQAFYNSHPTFEDTNNLSMVIHLEVAGVNFLFPGDLESNGWKTLLNDINFSNAVRKTNVFIAPHHGRESGIHREIFTEHGCKPHYVVMSDKCHMHDTQKTIDYYSSKTIGGPFRGETRRVLTTRKDGKITFQFLNSSWCPI
jgi:beta-lactamase superfamily II metal-dependent hydrolase